MKRDKTLEENLLIISSELKKIFLIDEIIKFIVKMLKKIKQKRYLNRKGE